MTDIETNIQNMKIIETAAKSTLKETSSFLKFNPIYIPIILFITMGIWGEYINLTDTNGRAEAFLLFGWIIGAFLSEMHHDYKRKIEDRMNALLYTLKNE